MNRMLREPLVHFLVGGALLFALYGLASNDAPYAPQRIVVDPSRVAALATTFQRIWMRPPTADELDSLIRDFVDEEILYREALALGLDRDDLVVRRRLRQKLEYLHSDLVEIAAPGEAELAEYLASNRDRFRIPARVSFEQIYVNPEAGKPDGSPYERAEVILAELRAGSASDGDNTLLPRRMQSASEPEIGAVFGDDFAADLVLLEGGGWLGPIASSFGLHLVRVDDRVPARMAELEEVRREVLRELESARRAVQNDRFLEQLRAQYEVEVRMPRDERTATSGPTATVGG